MRKSKIIIISLLILLSFIASSSIACVHIAQADEDSNESGIVLTKTGSGLENVANQIAIEKGWIYLGVNSSDPRIIHDEIVKITKKNQVEYLLILGDDDQIPIIDEFGLIPQDIHDYYSNVRLNETLDTLYYGNIDEDDFIELSVGRLPLQSEEKIRQYFIDLEPKGKINLIFNPVIGSKSPEQAKNYLWRYENINYHIPSSIEEAEYLLQNSEILGVYSHGGSRGFSWFSMSMGVPDMWNNRPVVVVSSCETAEVIGKEFIRQGASAYVGYYFSAVPSRNPMPIWEESTIGKSLKSYTNRLIAAKNVFKAFGVNSLFILYGDPSLEVDSPRNMKELTQVVMGNDNITIFEPPLNSRIEIIEVEFIEEKDTPIYKIRLRGLYPPSSGGGAFFFSELESYKEGNYVLWYLSEGFYHLNKWFSPDEALKRDDVPFELVVEISEEDAILYSENWNIDMEILKVSDHSPFQFGISPSVWFMNYYYVFPVSDAPNITRVIMKIGDEIVSTRPFGMYAFGDSLGTFAPHRFGVVKGNDEVYVVISLSIEDIANLIRLGACEESFEIIIKLDVEPTLPPILSNLAVTPLVIEFYELVTISFDIMNPNNYSISYRVNVEIEQVEDPPIWPSYVFKLPIDVKMEAYESKTVSHNVTPSSMGDYDVRVEGMTVSFFVETPVIPLIPANFVVSDLVIDPDELELGDNITISVLITNIGEEKGPYIVTMNITLDATLWEYSQYHTIEGEESKTAMFNFTPEAVGDYDVAVDGLMGNFIVLAIPYDYQIRYYIVVTLIISAIVLYWLRKQKLPPFDKPNNPLFKMRQQHEQRKRIQYREA